MSEGEQLLLPFELRPVLSPRSFYRSASNEAAFLWVQRWPNWPQQSLVLYGPLGCGKTHLGHIWQQHVGASWLVPKEIQGKTAFSLLEKTLFWVLDDAHLLEDELLLLQLYNLIQEQGGGLLLLAPLPPAHWPFQLPDLRSRLQTISAAPIAQPDDALLRQILVKLFEDQQVRAPEDVIAFLLRHMERSFASAQALVEKINQKSLMMHRPLTVPFIREIAAHLSLF